MAILFISDLHLEDSRPEITALFLQFLQRRAARADALYILGDLFEYWIGDDAQSDTASQVAAGLKRLFAEDVPCYFIHGNRDFLLGEEYAAQAGMQLLDDPCLVNLYDQPTLLLHGDTLCTDDTEYQAFRDQVRNHQWQQNFLRLPVAERLHMARQARDASRSHTSQAPTAIMDVNDQAVANAFLQHRVRHMIHGHTHRPGTHEYVIHGAAAERIVLGDWYRNGSVLTVTADGSTLEFFDAA